MYKNEGSTVQYCLVSCDTFMHSVVYVAAAPSLSLSLFLSLSLRLIEGQSPVRDRCYTSTGRREITNPQVHSPPDHWGGGAPTQLLKAEFMTNSPSSCSFLQGLSLPGNPCTRGRREPGITAPKIDGDQPSRRENYTLIQLPSVRV